MNHVSLSFCIATLNRGAFIGATLESIICQATDDVEIVILDGGSKDETKEVVEGYQARFSGLRFHRQDGPRGVDRDFATAVALARGEYCWLFSDDDLLKPGAIQTVLAATKDQFGLIIANAEVRNVDLSKVLERQRVGLSADRVYKPAENEDFLRDVLNYLTFIGGVVIRRDVWNAREKEKYFGSYFIHVGVIFQKRISEDILVIAKPLISIRYGNAMWLGKYFDVWMSKWPELIWSFADYTDALKREVCPREPWRRLKVLLVLRAKGRFTMKEYIEWLEPRLDSSWTRIWAKAIAKFPGRVMNFFALIYYRVFCRQPDRELTVMDLENSQYYFWK